MNLGESKSEPPVRTRRKLPAWVAMLLVLLLFPYLVLARYGFGWAAAEFAALIACLLPVLLVKPATWRRGPRWTFAFWIFTMTTVFFACAVLVSGLWLRPWLELSPWLCLVMALAAGVLVTVGFWPAQQRFYRAQRQPDAEQGGWGSASSDDPTVQ